MPRRSRVPANPLDCHERALRLLAVRPRARRELEVRLLRAGFEPDEVRDELERLEAVGLVDDEAFARQVVEHELAVRRSGRRAVSGRLAGKGVAGGTIERALEELAGGPGDEEARALELARSRLSRLGALDVSAAYRRLVPFLRRRGYGAGTAHRAASVALGLDGAVE
ncbi:MAG: regulatory protein RecX [Actinomycetota bacterium]